MLDLPATTQAVSNRKQQALGGAGEIVRRGTEAVALGGAAATGGVAGGVAGAGAAVGFAILGPPGAAVGFLVGLVGGTLGGAAGAGIAANKIRKKLEDNR